MDNKQMIHVACEGLLIGGIALYFSKQIKQMKKEVEELKGALASNQTTNEKRFEVIFNFLDNINGGFMPAKPQVKMVPQPFQPSSRQTKQVKPQVKVVTQPVKPVKKVQKVEIVKEEEDDMKEIEEERKMLLEEEECGEESCPIEEVSDEIEEDVEEHV